MERFVASMRAAFWATLHLFEDRKRAAMLCTLAIVGLVFQSMTAEEVKVWEYMISAVVPILVVVVPIFIWQHGRHWTLQQFTTADGLDLNHAFLHFADRDDQKTLSELDLKIRDNPDFHIQRMGEITPVAQRQELTNRMRREFRSKLKIGELTASGIAAGTDKRVPIPASHWDFLKMDFRSSAAEGGDHSYVEIRVRKG